MGNGAYALSLRIQLVRQMVLLARTMSADQQWTEPAEPEEFSLANQTLGRRWWKMNAKGEPPWARSVQRVTQYEMLNFIRNLRFPPALHAMLEEYISGAHAHV